MGRERIVIVGMGDVGLLTALWLPRRFEVVGISTKSCMVSAQNLGQQVARTEEWTSTFMTNFGQYRRLDGVEVIHGRAVGMDTDAQVIEVQLAAGDMTTVAYDAVLIASGVTNGFWRNGRVEHREAVEQAIHDRAEQVRCAARIAVVGGGPSAVSAAGSIKSRYPDKDVNLFYSREQILAGYHPKARADAANHLRAKGVTLHPGHRAILPQGFAAEQMTTEPVQWQTGQPDLNADLVLWAIGKILPNNAFIPDQMLNGDGFVRVTPTLQVDGFESVFAVGDIAATDKNRSSARNGGYFTAARNLRMFLDGRPHKMKPLPLVPTHRWGSIFGLEPDGLRLYLTGGQRMTVSAWLSANLLMRLIMGGLIYRGIRAFFPMVPRLRGLDKPSQR